MENSSTFGGMKKVARSSIKVDVNSIKAAKKQIKGTKVTIGECFEMAINRMVNPMYGVRDNCDEFRKFLDGKGIKWNPADHSTIIVGNVDIYSLGYEFGIYAAKNNSSLK